MVYQNNWKYGEPPTWPAKGWFEYSPGECTSVATNNFFGILSVVRSVKGKKLKPAFFGKRPVEDVVLSHNQSMAFDPAYLCLGQAPFDGYKDELTDYQKCDKGEQLVPFSIMFNHGGGDHFTLDLK